MIARPRTIAALAALASACTCSVPPPPTLDSMTPPRALAGGPTAVSVRGTGFVPWVQADLADPAASTVRATFALALVRDGARVPLESVRLVSDTELAARVPPLAGPATYDLELVDPRGRTAWLAAAFVVESACGADGTPCDDGNACTEGDACQGGVCAPGAPACGNTAPRACLAAAPAAAAAGEPVSLDASCSSDDEDPLSALQARFDVDGDGSWDTAFGPAGTARTLGLPAPGLWVATVEVADPGGLSSFASRLVVVAAEGDLVRVTTAADEADPGATPGAPGGTGLSLREAVTWVGALGVPRTISLAVEEPIVHASPLPPLEVAGASLVGHPAAPLEFPGVGLPCIVLDAPDQLLLDVTVAGCAGGALQLGTRSDRVRVAGCTIHGVPTAYGIDGKASGTIGPGNDVSGAAAGVRLSGADYVVLENRIHHNEEGISVVAGATIAVLRNRIVSNAADGLQATPSLGSCTLLHNVLDANGADGVDVGSFAGGLDVRNNLFTRNGGLGLRTGTGAVTLGPNGFFGNALGASAPAAPGPSDLLEDPIYAGDHRIAPGSPAVDRGVDVGLDVNGPAAGSWDGAAPDLGAWEAPYAVP